MLIENAGAKLKCFISDYRVFITDEPPYSRSCRIIPVRNSFDGGSGDGKMNSKEPSCCIMTTKAP